jgi:hypothetical protein
VVLPVEFCDVPGKHGEHSSLPTVAANRPTAQRWQEVRPVAAPLLPAGQALQLAADEDPTTELKRPTAQAMHSACPVDDEYEPARQGLHDVFSAASWNSPGGHSLQAVEAAEAEKLPLGQD